MNATNNPEEELKQKQEELKHAQDDVSALQKEIQALQAKVAEFQQATANYDTFYKASKKQLDEAKLKIADKTKMAKSIIGDTKATAIDGKIAQALTDFATELDGKKTKRKDARTELITAKKASLEADDVSLDKQADYEVVKKQPKDTEAALKDVQNLITLSENAHDSDDHVQMYLLAQIAEKALTDKITIPTLDEYKQALLAAKDAAEQKKQDAAAKKSDADQKASALTELSKNYDTAVASSRTDLLKILKEIKP